jgi:hypothetical protein
MKITIAKLLSLLILIMACAVIGSAQYGGKAEPNRIEFDRGKTSNSVSGTIKGDEQAEYIFGAVEGQEISVKIASAPHGNFSSFKILNAYDEPEFTSDLDVNYDYTFTAPYTGDYLIWVNFRPAGKVKSAKYSLTLAIK